MKASKFSEAQIAFVLKQTEDGPPIGEVCRKAGISDAMFYNWRKKYAGLLPVAQRSVRSCSKPLHPESSGSALFGPIKDYLPISLSLTIRRTQCSGLRPDHSLYLSDAEFTQSVSRNGSRTVPGCR
jgi:hypothetical protein